MKGSHLNICMFFSVSAPIGRLKKKNLGLGKYL
jgi:hypothetical protein